MTNGTTTDVPAINPDTTQTTSNLMKVARLVHGDDQFAMRVQAACLINNVDYVQQVLIHVAADTTVLSGVSVTLSGTVDSTAVTDDAIIAAVLTYQPPAASATS